MGFDIPVAVFIFKRSKAVDVIRRIGEVRPQKLYLIADEGRDEKEKNQVRKTRLAVEDAVDWECEIIKNYASENRGVYENIAGGVKWVFEKEKKAIFLEDDNLPEATFFEFCKEMLEMYADDNRILWICGTNYLGDYHPETQDSYVFTRHMLPCGWASWASKFLKYYDGNLEQCRNDSLVDNVEQNYCNVKVYKQYRRAWMGEFRRIQNNQRPKSWDYQMDFSIKANSLFGICPCQNQIKNIGVDEDSIHGGHSLTQEMTKRFCGMESYPMVFPLKHPSNVIPDIVFEKRIGEIILYPLKQRIIGAISRFTKRVLHIPENVRYSSILRRG